MSGVIFGVRGVGSLKRGWSGLFRVGFPSRGLGVFTLLRVGDRSRKLGNRKIGKSGHREIGKSKSKGLKGKGLIHLL